MTDGGSGAWTPWVPGQTPDAVDKAIMATRTATFPHFGLDPHDPRD
jgi:acetoin utilization protein AcuC